MMLRAGTAHHGIAQHPQLWAPASVGSQRVDVCAARMKSPLNTLWTPAVVCLLILAWAAATTAAARAEPAAALALAHNASADSSSCGRPGKPPCSHIHNCTHTALKGARSWRHNSRQASACRSRRSRLGPLGCGRRLTRVMFTPDVDTMPDLCLPLPQASSGCGQVGQACCLVPTAGPDPWTNIRAQCSAGLTCIVKSIDSLPYGSRRHAQTILHAAAGSSLAAALRSPNVMGICKRLQPQLMVAVLPEEVLVDLLLGQNATTRGEGSAKEGRLFMPCGYTQPCSKGTWCAGSEDHYLKGARCLPLPPCGGPNQPCCPPNAHGSFQAAHASILDNTTPMPFCTDPDSTCLWQPDMSDLSKLPQQNDLRLRPPQASYSMSVSFPGALCVPGLKQCGQKGQPCCPHAQYAASNTQMYFRSHVCDAGLACDATIDFTGEAPKLGTCRGVTQQCGHMGQECCRYTDAAGWSWKTCNDGQPGVYCSRRSNVCKVCPDSSSLRVSATLAADVGNAC